MNAEAEVQQLLREVNELIPLTNPIVQVDYSFCIPMYRFANGMLVVKQRIYGSWPGVQDKLDRVEQLLTLPDFYHNTSRVVTLYNSKQRMALTKLSQACHNIDLELLVKWIDLKTADNPDRGVQESLIKLNEALLELGEQFNIDVKSKLVLKNDTL